MTVAAPDKYAPHHRTLEVLTGKVQPVKATDLLPSGNTVSRLNKWLAIKITNGVGTMACAYVFALISLISLPEILVQAGVLHLGDVPNFLTKPGLILVISWIAQTFLQLVLLSIIIVGQNIQTGASDKRAENTFDDAEAVLHEARQIQQHLLDQDRRLEDIIAKFETQG